ncbi:MAG TPA: hypothetical protein PK522_00815 [Nitrosomonas sp.]|nr:hypothetical protein [Nitrosomonas sp.]
MKFKYWLCEHNQIDIAQGRMERVRLYPRKPKQCAEQWCDHNNFLEVIIDVIHPKKDAKNKDKPAREKLGHIRKKRQSTQQEV